MMLVNNVVSAEQQQQPSLVEAQQPQQAQMQASAILQARSAASLQGQLSASPPKQQSILKYDWLVKAGVGSSSKDALSPQTQQQQPANQPTAIAVLNQARSKGSSNMITKVDPVDMSRFTSMIMEKTELPQEIKPVVSNVTNQMFKLYAPAATALVKDALKGVDLQLLLSQARRPIGTGSRMIPIEQIRMPGRNLKQISPIFADRIDAQLLERVPAGELGEKGLELRGDLEEDWSGLTLDFTGIIDELFTIIIRVTKIIIKGKGKSTSSAPSSLYDSDEEEEAEEAEAAAASQKQYIPSPAAAAGAATASPRLHRNIRYQEPADFKKRATYAATLCFTAYLCCRVVADEIKVRYGGGATPGTSNFDVQFTEAFERAAITYMNKV